MIRLYDVLIYFGSLTMLGVVGKNNYAKAQLFKKIITKKNNIVKYLELFLKNVKKGITKSTI